MDQFCFNEGFVRLETCSPKVFVGDPEANVKEMIKMINNSDAQIVHFPELNLTGYTCADLFLNQDLLSRVEKAHQTLLNASSTEIKDDKLIVYGAPYFYNGSLYNCAFVMNNHKMLGIVPKKFIPNYKEFYEKRWFSSYSKEAKRVPFLCSETTFGNNLLFTFKDLVIGVEICEDVWSVIPPSSYHALAGANLILNLSASNDLVGKADYRSNLIKQQSERTISAYSYASTGCGESTTDVVFGGHIMVYENGTKLAENDRFSLDSTSVVSDIDFGKINLERIKNPTFNDSKNVSLPYLNINIPFLKENKLVGSFRPKNKTPFLPPEEMKNSVYEEITKIQVHALAKRIMSLPSKKVVVGISGGSDSTLALLVTRAAFDLLKLDPSNIIGITMPGYGTSGKTLKNSLNLMKLLGIQSKEISIKDLSTTAFKDIGHVPFNSYIDNSVLNLDNLTTSNIEQALLLLPTNSEDLVFENVQARLRTFLLMSHGFVIGTGDMSELALGWCKYNGDHMSMYNPNCSIPKTLVKELIKYHSDSSNDFEIQKVLMSIYHTVVSPELLPLKYGEIAQVSEDKVGPYLLNDYFLYHFMRNGFSFSKIRKLALSDFENDFTKEEITKWLNNFIKRFFTAQFKRSCVPDGPKVGSVSLSPRGDLRLPSDVDPNSWTLKD